MEEHNKKNFFISHSSTDTAYAEWIAWILENEGFSTIIDAWDFPAGKDFVDCMNEAMEQSESVIIVASPEYWSGNFTPPEWKYFFAHDSKQKDKSLLIVKIRACTVPPVLETKIYINLVDTVDEGRAKENLVLKIPADIKKITPNRNNQISKPSFPPSQKESAFQGQAFDEKFLYFLGNLNQTKQQTHFIDHVPIDASCLNNAKTQGFIAMGSREEIPIIIAFTLAHLLKEIHTETPDIIPLKTKGANWKLYKNKPQDFLWRLLYLNANNKQAIKDIDDARNQIKEELQHEEMCKIFYREVLSEETQNHDFLTNTLLAWSEMYSQETETRSHFLLLVCDTDLLGNSDAIEQWKAKMEESLAQHKLHNSLLPLQTSPTINEDLTNWMIAQDIDYSLRRKIYAEFLGIEKTPLVTLTNKLFPILKDYPFQQEQQP